MGISLFLIPTVLADNTTGLVLPNAIPETVKNLNIFFVENIRTARRFISSLKLNKVIDDLTFYELDKNTPEHVTRQQIKDLKENAGILSEAGCPGIADPGAIAVKIGHELNLEVVPLVGPSSILLALMASGFSGQSFAFSGYLSIDKMERRKDIQKLERYAQQGQTQIFMETPFRNNQLLQALIETCNPNTLLCIASNVTATDEFVKTKTIKDWSSKLPDLHKKPTIFVLGQ